MAIGRKRILGRGNSKFDVLQAEDRVSHSDQGKEWGDVSLDW